MHTSYTIPLIEFEKRKRRMRFPGFESPCLWNDAELIRGFLCVNKLQNIACLYLLIVEKCI